MATEKTYFPVKTVCLCGLSDIFPVRESLAVTGGIALAAKQPMLRKEQSLEVRGDLTLKTNKIGVLGQKVGLPVPGALVLSGALSSATPKVVHPAPCGIQLGGSLLLTSRRYRTIGDLEGLTIGDIQDWTLETFYYVEV